MDDYNSKFTGQEIDDAIDRAKAGGAIDVALQNKAPAGYGLGGNAKQLTSADNLDNIRENGWYWWYDTRPSGAEYNYCHMRVDNGQTDTANSVMQTIYRNSVNVVMVRFYNGKNWITEYVNPLMGIDSEYRTTERYRGKPVYAMMRPSKTLGAAGSTVYIEGLPGNIEDVIDYRLQIKSSGGVVTMNNRFNSDGSAQCVSNVQVTTEHYAWAIIKCISDCTSLTATCTFKYTKTTD